MIVLDCCAAIEIARRTEIGLAYKNLFFSDEEIIAPSLYQAEVVNVAWKYVHGKALSRTTAHEVMETALALPNRYIPIDDLMVEAFSQGVILDHSIYDMIYMILARRNGATLVTVDKHLQSLCLDNGVDCIIDEDVLNKNSRAS